MSRLGPKAPHTVTERPLSSVIFRNSSASMIEASSSATSRTSNPISFTLGMRWNSFVLNGDVHTHVLTPIFIAHPPQDLRNPAPAGSDSTLRSQFLSFNLPDRAVKDYSR